jgi:hypothetical protein
VHGAAAAYYPGGKESLIEELKRDLESAPVSDKLKALLAIAGRVQKGGKQVTDDDVERARKLGATDKEIHDTVLIAAAFCMFNRYVDGLATWAPQDLQRYRESGKRLAEEGYIHSTDLHRNRQSPTPMHAWPEVSFVRSPIVLPRWRTLVPLLSGH